MANPLRKTMVYLGLADEDDYDDVPSAPVAPVASAAVPGARPGHPAAPPRCDSPCGARRHERDPHRSPRASTATRRPSPRASARGFR